MIVRTLGGSQHFICKRWNLVFDAFSYSEPVLSVRRG